MNRSRELSSNRNLPRHVYNTRYAARRLSDVNSNIANQSRELSSNISLPGHTHNTRNAARRFSNYLLERESRSCPVSSERNLQAMLCDSPRRSTSPNLLEFYPHTCGDECRRGPWSCECSGRNCWTIASFVLILVAIIGYFGINFLEIKTDVIDIKDLMEQMQVMFDKRSFELQGDERELHKKETTKKLEAIRKDLLNNKYGQDPKTVGSAGCGVNSKLNRQVYELVKKALEKYNADRTGKTDFALDTLGGRIVSIGSTVPLQSRSMASFFGITICPQKHDANALIQASSMPGECWAFEGSTGDAIVELLGFVRIDGVTLEHIPKSISPSGTLNSAPKEFSILGVHFGSQEEKTLLGSFVYRIDRSPLQYFPVKNDGTKSYRYVEFRVHSNHGNHNYTCVYRLRVHGTLDTTKKDDRY